MASNIRQFDATLDRHGREIMPEQAAEFHRDLATVALRRVVRLTPARSGRARGAWRVRATATSRKFPNTPDRFGGTTIARGQPAIERVKPFRKLWLTNAAPYAWRLEHGWSDQAPAGMVRITMEMLRARAERGPRRSLLGR